jgi:hypothetical protein
MLPYDDSNKGDLITRIKSGQRPSRPTDSSSNQWLQDRIWDAITTCWSDKPEDRRELSTVYHVFSTPNRRNANLDKPGNLNVPNSRNFTITEKF